MSDEPLIARPANRSGALIKTMIWGEAGSGKTRCALSFPKPLVLDLERGSEWYAKEFDFWIATPTPQLPTSALVRAVVKQLLDGRYPDRETLIIDPITDYLDQLELLFIGQLKQRGMDPDSLTGPKKAQAYAYIRDQIRDRLDSLLQLPMHIVFVARAKNVWGKGPDGKMAPVARTYDARDIVEYLCDVVLLAERGLTARVLKSRIALLPEVLDPPRFETLARAMQRGNVPQEEPAANPAPPAEAPPPPEGLIPTPASWIQEAGKTSTAGDVARVELELQPLLQHYHPDDVRLINAAIKSAKKRAANTRTAGLTAAEAMEQ